MILNKLTKKWLAGERLTGNYWLSTGTYRGCPVIFITWPQDNNKSEVITYITKNDLVDGDPLIELFDLGVTPDWLNQDQFEIGLGWDTNKPILYSNRYRLNKYPSRIAENVAKRMELATLGNSKVKAIIK